MNKPFSLVFFGDVHKYAPQHCNDKWREFINEYRRRNDCWFVGMGD